MSKKRSLSEFNDVEKTGEASDSFQRDVKRAKLVPSSDTTLEDLPNELLASILVKAVVTEVRDMKLAKSVWKEKADLVIARLGTVCSLWSDILSTNFLRNKVHEILDDTAQEKLRLEVLHQSAVELFVEQVATMNDEVFMLCTPQGQAPFINVHDRSNIGQVKCVIPLQGLHPVNMTANGVSNCLYVLSKDSHCYSVLRIKRDGTNQFSMSPWISDLGSTTSHEWLHLALNGALIISTNPTQPNPSLVSIYDASGHLQHTISLSPTTYRFRCIYDIIPKSNGNLVLATCPDTDVIYGTVLMEIDTTGRIIRQLLSRSLGMSGINVADAYGRIWIFDWVTEVEVYDSEFNHLNSTVRPKEEGLILCYRGNHYNSERNEIANLYNSSDMNGNSTTILTIFRFTAE